MLADGDEYLRYCSLKFITYSLRLLLQSEVLVGYHDVDCGEGNGEQPFHGCIAGGSGEHHRHTAMDVPEATMAAD